MIAVQQGKKALAVSTKFGPGGGGLEGILPAVGGVKPSGFRQIPQPSFPFPQPTPFIPIPAPLGPTTPTTQPSGGLATAACNLLSGTARDLCLIAAGFFPGGTPAAPGTGIATTGCGPGLIRVGDTCVALGDAFPGGDPVTSGAGGVATVGAFGLPALSPTGISRIVRKCGRGMVLGIDNLCYPKAVLTSRSKFRKWRRPPKPPISRRDVVAIGRAARARDRVLELAKDVGLSVSKSKRKKAPAKQHPHHHSDHK